jgi:hypothetical protein
VTEVNTILHKVFVKEFYRLNAGFFLVIVILTFGFMSGVEHKALAEFFIASPVVMLIPIAVWTIYLIKIVSFNRHQLTLSENQFLFEIVLLPRSRQSISFLLALSSQFLPAILYGCFLVLMAAKHQKIIPILIVVLSISLLLLVSVTLMQWMVASRLRDKRITGIKRFLDYKFSKPFVQFYTEWVIRQEPVMLLGTKIFSGILIFAVTQLYKGEDYDWRLLAMGATIAFIANFMVIAALKRFEGFRLSLLRNLPMSLMKRSAIHLAVMTILCIPEVILLIRNFPENLPWQHSVFTILFGISICMFLYGLSFINSIQHKDPVRWIFGAGIAWILLVLWKVPLELLAAVNFMIWALLMKTGFYNFEYSVVEDYDKRNGV